MPSPKPDYHGKCTKCKKRPSKKGFYKLCRTCYNKRMQRREEEGRNQLLIEELNRLFEKADLPVAFSDRFLHRYSKGAGELELVRSGLDDTMRLSYQAMSEVWKSNPKVSNLRTAGYLVAIDRVAASYQSKGI